MIGDYTKVPLRPGERWTGARLRQGQVLLEHEWNLNLDASTRREQTLAFDAIGPRGVLRGSNAFAVSVNKKPDAPVLTIDQGYMWVGGLLAVAPTSFKYGDQDGVPNLPTTGKIVVVVEAFQEHVQPAEAPDDLVDPALAPIETAARTRVGYRVRFATTTALTAREAWETFRDNASVGSTGLLSIDPIPQTAPPDPCSPPPDPAGLLEDGLLRIEVLQPGDEKSAIFAWSFENGSAAAPVKTIAGSLVTVVPPPGFAFQAGQLVELSWLSRRADRAGHGPLYTIDGAPTAAGGTAQLQLKRSSVNGSSPAFAPPPTGAQGIVVRRWDGQAKASGAAVEVSYRGQKVLAFTPGQGSYEAGDWWGARVRAGIDGVEKRTSAPPDGTRHMVAPLALVDLDQRLVEDLRPKFRSLVDVDVGSCSVGVYPGDDVQAVIDSLPVTGGEVCFKAGTYEVAAPLRLDEKKRRVVLHGAGPSTVIRATTTEAAIVFDGCAEVEVRAMRIEGGPPSTAGPGDLDGALTFLACRDVRVLDCVIGCRDATDRKQTCLTVRSTKAKGDPDLVRIERNSFEVGALQTAVLLVGVNELRVQGNRVSLAQAISGAIPPPRFGGQGIVVGGTRARVVQILDNVLNDVAEGIHLGLDPPPGSSQRGRAGDVLIRGNVVNALVPPGYTKDRHAVYVGNSDCIHVVGTAATLRSTGGGPPPACEGVTIYSSEGPFIVVRETCLDGYNVGVSVVDPGAIPQTRLWVVSDTMAANGKVGADITGNVLGANNVPTPPEPELTGLAVSPASVAGGTGATGTVTLKSPAPRSVVVNLSAAGDGAANVVLPTPPTVTVTAGATTQTFPISTTLPPAGQDKKPTISAQIGTAPAQSAPLMIIAKPALANIALNPTTIIGQPGAQVSGTVTITAPDPTAVVTITSDKSAVQPVAPTVAIPSGTTGAFKLNVSAVNSDQTAQIKAEYNGVERSASLLVQQLKALKVSRILLLNINRSRPSDPYLAGDVLFDSQKAGGTFLSTKVIEVMSYEKPNAIQIEFTSDAQVDTTSVNLSTLKVEQSTSGVAGPTNQAVVFLSSAPNSPPFAVRWVAGSMPFKEADTKKGGDEFTTYAVTLVGVGSPAIRSTQGRRLDGALNGFPTGTGGDGSNLAFKISIEDFRDPPEPKSDYVQPVKSDL